MVAVAIRDDFFHHVFVVCRQQLGSRFEALHPNGIAYLVEVTKLEKKSAWGQILSSRALPKPGRPYIHLALSTPKPSTLESVLVRSVELGVKSIWPFVSDYSFFKSSQEFQKIKGHRWEKIILSATQQTGRGDRLTLEKTVDLKACIERATSLPSALLLFPFEGDTALTLDQAIHAKRSGIPAETGTGLGTEQEGAAGTEHEFCVENIVVFVGSEGGFSSTEVETLKKNGLNPCTLGEQILRVETACLAIVSILKYEFNLMQ